MILLILVLVSLRIQEPQIAAAAETILAGSERRDARRGRRGAEGRAADREYLLDLVRGFFSGPGPVTGSCTRWMPPGAVALGLALGSTMQVDLGMSADQIARIQPGAERSSRPRAAWSVAGCRTVWATARCSESGSR